VQPTGGGRVTELTARPLLAAFHPQLAAFRQPLAGEFAARRELLERTAFCTGYGVEIGLLLDVYAQIGIGAMAQVDLDSRQNRHRPLEELAPMADAVLAVILDRLRCDGRLAAGPHRIGGAAPERPPLAGLRAIGREAA
jgi:glucosyl-3-phosphoglycerate synthase